MTGANGPSGDQDIDTAGTDADDQSPTKAMGTGVPGDTSSADIVGRTGEEMPVQSHDGLEPESHPRSAAKGSQQQPVRSDDDNSGGNVAD